MKKFYRPAKNHTGGTESYYDVRKRELAFQNMIRVCKPINFERKANDKK